MKVKVITTTEPGVISLTPEELQELLNEAYNEGYYDGKRPLYACGTITTTATSDQFSTSIPKDSNIAQDSSIKISPYTISYCTETNENGVSISTIGGAIKNEI